MPEFSVDAVLFDLDGTLVDSTASVHRNWTRIAQVLGRPGEDLVGELHGIPGHQVLRMREPGLSEDRVAELNRMLIDGEVADTVDVVPTRGAAELLAVLPPAAWAVVTSGPLRLAAARIAAAGLPFPRYLVTADDVRIGKPDPEPFLLGAAAVGHSPGRCLAVEDAPAGISSARSAGCRVLGVLATYPELDADTVPDLGALHVEVTDAGLRVCY